LGTEKLPLSPELQSAIDKYCSAHLAEKSWYENRFDFIKDLKLKETIILEFMSARYVYKVGEALQASKEKLFPFIKFQITQYASIYEAVIVHLLWTKYKHSQEVNDLEHHFAYKEAGKFPKGMSLQNDKGEILHLCVQRKEKTITHSIRFDDKVNCAVRIGFVRKTIGEDIKEFYRIRNAIHLETAVNKLIAYELSQSVLAYQRMKPFVDDIKMHLPSANATLAAQSTEEEIAPPCPPS
jgi:hypothetical protein